LFIFEKKHHLEQFPKVAVVILNWNGSKYLEEFLPGILHSEYPELEVVVADNASTDDSVALLTTHFPSVTLIQHPQNGGFARGYNEALKLVKADYYILLNNDVEITPGWVEPAIRLMEENRVIAAVQPKILSYHKKDHFEYAGACGGWIDRFGFPFARGRIFDACEPDEGQYNDPQPVFWASGAALFVRASAYHSMDGFDEYFFAHQEEIDLCWRLQLAGHSVWVCPSSIVYHVGGGTLPAGNPRKVFLNFRNNLVMMHKNLPRKGKWATLWFRLLLDGVAALRFLVAGKGGSCIAVIKAHIHFFRKVGSGTGGSNPQTRLQSLPGCFNGSIVWAYFVKKKKTFRAILADKQ
jgi:GT2 family glycosyltransferase